MAKKESTLLNMIVSLMVITMVSGGVLGLVYNLTKPAIDMVEANKNISAINEVLKTDKEIAEIKGMYDKYRRHKVFDVLPFPLFFGLYRLYDLILYKDKI